MGQRHERLSGTLTSWNDDRGFGFICRAGTTRETFVHISAFPPREHRPQPGEALTFEVELSPAGKWRATRVRPAVHSPRLTPRLRHTRPAGARRIGGAAAYLAIPGLVIAYVLVDAIWPVPLWVPALYLSASGICFLTYAVDKAAAVSGGWRISERTLLLLGLVGGWPGGIIAQQVLRHKTQKASFRSAFWSSVLVNVFGVTLFTTPLFTLFTRWLADHPG